MIRHLRQWWASRTPRCPARYQGYRCDRRRGHTEFHARSQFRLYPVRGWHITHVWGRRR